MGGQKCIYKNVFLWTAPRIPVIDFPCNIFANVTLTYCWSRISLSFNRLPRLHERFDWMGFQQFAICSPIKPTRASFMGKIKYKSW